jgi:hypothetical protein
MALIGYGIYKGGLTAGKSYFTLNKWSEVLYWKNKSTFAIQCSRSIIHIVVFLFQSG